MSTPARVKPKPCTICRHWFTPSPRLGERQRACGPVCSREHERRRQAARRGRNPGYAAQRRADADVQRLEQAEGSGNDDGVARILGPAPPFYRQVPWQTAKTVMGAQDLVLLAKFGRLAHRDAKTAMQRQYDDLKREFGGLRREVAKTVIAPGERPLQPAE